MFMFKHPLALTPIPTPSSSSSSFSCDQQLRQTLSWQLARVQSLQCDIGSTFCNLGFPLRDRGKSKTYFYPHFVDNRFTPLPYPFWQILYYYYKILLLTTSADPPPLPFLSTFRYIYIFFDRFWYLKKSSVLGRNRPHTTKYALKRPKTTIKKVLKGFVIFFVPRGSVIFCPKRLRDFLPQEVAWYVFVQSGCVIFCPKMLPDFFLSQEVVWFIFVLRGCIIFCCPERLRDFSPPRACMIFVCPERQRKLWRYSQSR